MIYGNQWYHSVQIGNQCWLKENLNIGNMVPAVQDQANTDAFEKFCYNNDPSNCSLYGGLYQLREAMQFTQKVGARGICPIGWHIPSSAEFDTLLSSVNGDGDALKTIGQGSGTNTSGFSSLLSGFNALTAFINLNVDAEYWTSNTSVDFHYNFLNANFLTVLNSNVVYQGIPDNGVDALAVRCLKDDTGLLLQAPYGGESWQSGSTHKINWGGSNVNNIKIEYSIDNASSWNTIANSVPASDGIFNWTVPNTPSVNCRVRISDINNSNTISTSDTVFTIYNSCPGGSTVEYSGKTYHTVVIGNQCWLKENIDIGTMIPGNTESSTNGVIEKYCYNDDPANCTIYGGLYQYSELIEPGLCPTGWHNGIVSDIDQNVLYDGNALKAVGQGTGFGAGSNTSGFSALLAGARNSDGTFSDLGNRSFFPSNSSYSQMLVRDFPYGGSFADLESTVLSPNDVSSGLNLADVIFSYSSDISYTDHFGNTTAGSVRCVYDNLVSPLPVELTLFTAIAASDNVKLNWNTATELNTLSFDIEKKNSNNDTWQTIASIKASGNSYSTKNYSFTDKIVNAGNYSYRLKMIDNDGSFKYSSIENVEVSAPAKYELQQNFPNPWNPTTTIRYRLPINSQVTIKLFDALGKEVTTLVNEIKTAGNYEVTLNGKNLSSGIYYYQMKAGNFIETKKITLIK